MPSSSHARMMRRAISPRFATRTVRITAAPGPPQHPPARRRAASRETRAALPGLRPRPWRPPALPRQGQRSSADGPPATRLMSALAAATACGPQASTPSTTRRTSSSSSPGSTTACTRPISRARSAENARSGEEQLARGRLADLGDDVGRDDRRHDAEPDLGESEDGVARGDHDVADGGQAGTAAERGAVHAADERKRQGVEPAVHLRERLGVAEVLLPRVVHRPGHPREVAAGREHGTGAAQDGRADREIGVPRDRPAGEFVDHLLVEGVADVRPVEREVLDGAVAAGQQVGERHRYILKTPKRASGIGALKAAESPRASVSRVCTGSSSPSSHNRAVA